MPIYVMRMQAGGAGDGGRGGADGGGGGSGSNQSLGATRREQATREELLQSGLTPAQADHEMVHRHEIEVVEENFTRWVIAFGCIICMLVPVSISLFFFLVYSYISESVMQGKPCDVPLDAWFIVVLSNIIYHNIHVCGRSIHRQVIRVFCCYDMLGRQGQPPEAPPRRVRLYHLLITTFDFGWHCVGLHWVRISLTCNATSPNLYRSVHLFAAFSVVFTIFTTLSTFGLYQMLASLLRRGLLPALPDRRAPEGTLEQQETVVFDLEASGENLQCPTCLEDFCKESKIKKTVCGHYFHEECLAPWLRVNRTCPLCRSDLARGLDASAGQSTADGPETIGAPTYSAEESADEVVVPIEAEPVQEPNGNYVEPPQPQSYPSDGAGIGNTCGTVVVVSPGTPARSEERDPGRMV
mmetsp:Transcript_49563/g.127959  ORF Transcript_49563/g.127959 Transcript_49563/m.127959 type:complete len:411 (-) Transcript_49563:210-1442(-)